MKSPNRQLEIVTAVVAHHHVYLIWFRVGRFGVDLFVVMLSGFLFSSLLFSEYKTNQSIDFGRCRLAQVYAFFTLLGRGWSYLTRRAGE